jgi:chorismate mutase-like protein
VLSSQANLQDFVSTLGQAPLQYEPGSRWHYSVSVDVQGRLVEVISGMRFGEFLEQRLFKPLGMNDTSFTVPEEKLDRFAQLYRPQAVEGSDSDGRGKTTELVVARERANRNYRPGATFESGGGGLVATTADYMRFSQMLLNGGELDGVRILSPKTVELMTTDQLGDVTKPFGRKGVGFGLGFAVMLDKGQIGELGSDGEYNWGGLAGTRFWIDPEEELIGIFMVQSVPHTAPVSVVNSRYSPIRRWSSSLGRLRMPSGKLSDNVRGTCFSLLLVLVAGSAGAASARPDAGELISQRLALMQDVAAFKWANGLPIEDLERERIVLEAAVRSGLDHGLTATSVESFFALQIKAAKEIQRYWFDRWGRDDDAPPAPDLATTTDRRAWRCHSGGCARSSIAPRDRNG